jgi:hypothetical protein
VKGKLPALPTLAFPAHTPAFVPSRPIPTPNKTYPLTPIPGFNATFDRTNGPEATEETSISKESPAGGGRGSDG